jgi:hypothetical protein
MGFPNNLKQTFSSNFTRFLRLVHRSADVADDTSPWGTYHSRNGRIRILTGKISDVVPAHDDPDNRWKICISDYSVCPVRDAWKGLA